ncbi:cell division protein DivIVA [Streptomonospora alba]|uniref:Cell wall synthesis protein Wag31 n=1 Tax=Streptomonospora alba TaxID=183763 RepID=A0A0C2G1B8_9ACTN|nr:DivIVA domain-containing protein [Streptomonospora alba]KIH97113.1 cell division protein DivIVA [Streptomonospora alba]
MPLTPGDIRNKQFNTVRLRPGYNEEDVDALLDRVEATFAGLQGGLRSGPPMTAEEVEHAKFRTTRLSPGYDEEEVDAFLDIVAAELRAHGLSRPSEAAWPSTGPQPPQRPQGGPQAPPARHGPGPADGPPPPPPPPGPPAPAPPPVGGPPRPVGPPPSAQGGRPPLRPEDIRNQQFSTTRLTTGYHEEEVDAFLDSAEATLEALVHGHPERAPLSAAHVDRVKFSTTRARPGYDPAQVDAFLDFLAQEFRHYEGTE